MAAVVADAGVTWVLMHWRGHSRDMQALATYDDVVAEVRDELRGRADAAIAAGVDPTRSSSIRDSASPSEPSTTGASARTCPT
jgi:dihydropteroate synthase